MFTLGCLAAFYTIMRYCLFSFMRFLLPWRSRGHTRLCEHKRGVGGDNTPRSASTWRLQRCTILASYILPILVPTVCVTTVHFMLFHVELSLDCVVHKRLMVHIFNPRNYRLLCNGEEAWTSTRPPKNVICAPPMLFPGIPLRGYRITTQPFSHRSNRP